jgi:hypothetical protein
VCRALLEKELPLFNSPFGGKQSSGRLAQLWVLFAFWFLRDPSFAIALPSPTQTRTPFSFFTHPFYGCCCYYLVRIYIHVCVYDAALLHMSVLLLCRLLPLLLFMPSTRFLLRFLLFFFYWVLCPPCGFFSFFCCAIAVRFLFSRRWAKRGASHTLHI